MNEYEKAKLEQREQDERVRAGKPLRRFSNTQHRDAGKLKISRTGAVYQIQKNGSVKRLDNEATKAIHQKLADNPVRKECGAILHGYYCHVCRVSRIRPCAKVEQFGAEVKI